jgi:hypothetical protein
MIWVPVTGDQPDLVDHTLILPSCDPSKVDQLAVDCLCFNFGTLIGRLISPHLDFVVSQDPYRTNTASVSTSIDVYSGEVPPFGRTVLLRVSSLLPSTKRRILDYSKDLIAFSQSSKCKQILLLRAVSSVFCIEPQIQDWPKTIRAVGAAVDILKIAPLEDYGEANEPLRATVVGDLFTCLHSLTTLPFGAVFTFVEDGENAEQAVVLAQTVSGKADLNIPPAWRA